MRKHSKVFVINGQVIFEENVLVKAKAQILFKDGAKVIVSEGKKFETEAGDDTSTPILVRHIDDAALEGANGRYVGFDLSAAGDVDIKNLLMVGGQVQLKLPASAKVGFDDAQHAVRLYNAATQAIEAGADSQLHYVHIRNATNALKIQGATEVKYALIENTMDKIISHAGAAPTLEHVNVEMLPLTATPGHKFFEFGAAPTGQGNRILRKDNKHLPRDGKGFKDNGDNTATLGSDGKTVNVDIDATPNTTGYSETRTTKSTVYKENNNNDLFISLPNTGHSPIGSYKVTTYGTDGITFTLGAYSRVGQYLNNGQQMAEHNHTFYRATNPSPNPSFRFFK